jgi:hypothetical protein
VKQWLTPRWEYRFLKDYVTPPPVGADDAALYSARAKEILHKYFPFLLANAKKKIPPLTVPNPHGYPIGTIIPLRILPDGRYRHSTMNDYLFLFDWHYHPPGGPIQPWGWHPGITVFGPTKTTVKDFLGRWFVEFDTGWSWYYTFKPNHIAVSTDIHDPPKRFWSGRWHFAGKSIKITWNAAGREEWLLPLDSRGLTYRGQRGQSLIGQGELSAEKLAK